MTNIIIDNKVTWANNNQNTKYTEQGKNIKVCKGEKPSNIKLDMLGLHLTSHEQAKCQNILDIHPGYSERAHIGPEY